MVVNKCFWSSPRLRICHYRQCNRRFALLLWLHKQIDITVNSVCIFCSNFLNLLTAVLSTVMLTAVLSTVMLLYCQLWCWLLCCQLWCWLLYCQLWCCCIVNCDVDCCIVNCDVAVLSTVMLTAVEFSTTAISTAGVFSRKILDVHLALFEFWQLSCHFCVFCKTAAYSGSIRCCNQR